MSDLLQQSIADAKAVRETAMANAKAVLEESFSKSMKEMFSEKLAEEMEDGNAENSEATIEEDIGSSGIGKNKGNTESSQSATEPAAVASKTSTDTSGNKIDIVKEGEDFDSDEDDEDDEDTGEELDEVITTEDIDSVIAEMEAEDTCAGDAIQAADADVAEAEIDGIYEEEINIDEILAELDAEAAEEEVPVAAAPEVPVAAAPEVPVAPAPEVPVAPAPEASAEEEEFAVSAPTPNPAEELNIEEMADALLAINEENSKLKKSLGKHINAIKELRGILNETNLLNAKLLYTNKLFKGRSLNESQKMKIINTFDLTENLREVKLAYKVLAESINTGKSVVKRKSNNTTAHSITEGIASNPIKSTKPASSKILTEETTQMASRFKELAGIKDA